jgi:hypothetical protein
MHILDQQCPKCGATDCRLSRAGALQYLARLIWLRPVRCNRCRHRFWRFAPKVGGQAKGHRRRHRRHRSKDPGSDPAGG